MSLVFISRVFLASMAADPSQYYYSGYGQGQEHYGYSMPQDPNAYYGGYPGGYSAATTAATSRIQLLAG
ncbi:hypothetical protein Bca4012_053741 [Brassica carinata]|uniref:Uncharacterized protein n=1 Tax=Brassica carinata TaxID=52824 RepID=A0A8X7VY93_BRACI|nr:hypothetical protein Bca52824_013244 [Brassica carinata]